MPSFCGQPTGGRSIIARWPRDELITRPGRSTAGQKKIEQREHIANAPSIPGAIIVTCILWFALVFGAAAIAPAAGAVMAFVGIPIAIIFYKKCAPTINRVWDTKAIAEKQRQKRENP